MRILLIEDDLRLADQLSEMLKIQGIFTEHISSIDDLAMTSSPKGDIEAIILDRLLGYFDTKTALPQLRKQFTAVPIIILSAINTPNERTELLNLGADDYMGKPFATHELIARINAAVRRSSTKQPSLYIKAGNLVIDTLNRTVSVEGQTATLPAKEFSVLRALCQQIGKVWSKSELLDYIWGHNALVETNVVEATVTNIRKKLASLGANISIRNMRNAGYWVEE